MTRDPRRWLEPRSGAHPNLRALLEHGRDELPSAERLAAIAHRLGSDFAAPNANAAGASGGAGAALSLLAMGLVLAGFGGAAYVALRTTHGEVASTAAAPEIESKPAAITVPSTGSPSRAVPETPAPSAAKPHTTMAAVRKPQRARPILVAPDPVAELALLDTAQSALRTAPEDALAHAEQHAARYPHGQYEQEREIIAIDALLLLGRDRAAEQRAVQFLSRFPGSGYTARARQQLASARVALTRSPAGK